MKLIKIKTCKIEREEIVDCDEMEYLINLENLLYMYKAYNYEMYCLVFPGREFDIRPSVAQKVFDAIGASL